MARQLSHHYAGGWYHITTRGIGRREILRDDRDRRHFLELLEDMAKETRRREGNSPQNTQKTQKEMKRRQKGIFPTDSINSAGEGKPRDIWSFMENK